MLAETFRLRMLSIQVPSTKCLVDAGFALHPQLLVWLLLVLHFRKKGVNRELLEQVLFGERDIDDVHHATRSVVYNANRKLKAMGLPDARCIQQRKGVCHWKDAVPVQEDASEFERLDGEAEKEEEPGRRLELCLEACQCYKGEFLPAQTGILWVAREARRYREMFCKCEETAAVSTLSNWDTVRESRWSTAMPGWMTSRRSFPRRMVWEQEGTYAPIRCSRASIGWCAG